VGSREAMFGSPFSDSRDGYGPHMGAKLAEASASLPPNPMKHLRYSPSAGLPGRPLLALERKKGFAFNPAYTGVPTHENAAAMKTFLPLTIPALCLLGIVAAPALAADVSEQKRHAYEAVERNAQQIAIVGDALYYYAELGMQELESAKFLKETLEGIGFAVEVGGAGLPTSVWAKWGKGRPVIAIVTEVAARPHGSQTARGISRMPLFCGAPGHMEGHNTHGGVAVGAAYALKRTMERYNLPGTVVLSFGPAEEQLISRPFLVRAGYFKDVDAAILIHIGDNLGTAIGVQNYAAISAKFTYHGRTAHGAVAPWEGKDALDAVELMSIGLDKLREHLRPTYRAHRTITMGGIQPNIIPDLAQIWWYVRDATGPWAKENYDK